MIDKVTATQGVYQTGKVAQPSQGEQGPVQVKQRQTSTSSQQSYGERQEVKPEEMKEVVESLNKFMKPSNNSIKFQYHEDLNEYYVTVVDELTDEVIREIPTKKLLDMYAAMTEYIGLMVDRKI